MASRFALLFVFGALSCAAAFGQKSELLFQSDLDIYVRGEWVGEMNIKRETAVWDGKEAERITRRTQITRSMGKLKASTSHFELIRDPEGAPYQLKFSTSEGREVHEMRVKWKGDELSVTRTGRGSQGDFEPITETLKADKDQPIGGGALDPLLTQGISPKKSTVQLSLNLETRKIEETRVEYRGEATYAWKGEKRAVYEYHIRKGAVLLWRVLLDASTDVPLRIEGLEGLLMVARSNKGKAPAVLHD